ncbi:hypothetical protein DFP72DRAFT_861936 [Ephemerocybe angulata]|uniref:Uncharacterized protein n=1 Tax=Ephemerocybe angulata TaxID=980116 RepID=A0A8H6H8S6_9AGAR|nr:hypothetical protein DFP72DRAFT_861936 [Tulosesus angulatus]
MFLVHYEQAQAGETATSEGLKRNPHPVPTLERDLVPLQRFTCERERHEKIDESLRLWHLGALQPFGIVLTELIAFLGIYGIICLPSAEGGLDSTFFNQPKQPGLFAAKGVAE